LPVPRAHVEYLGDVLVRLFQGCGDEQAAVIGALKLESLRALATFELWRGLAAGIVVRGRVGFCRRLHGLASIARVQATLWSDL